MRLLIWHGTQLQRKCYAANYQDVALRDATDGVVALEAAESSDVADEVLGYFASLILRALHSLVEISQLYRLMHEELFD